MARAQSSVWPVLLSMLTFFVTPKLSDGTTMTAFRRDLSVVPVRAAINRDARYGAWPNPTNIPYRMDATYTSSEQALILQAMAQISSDMNGCIRFQAYVAGTIASTVGTAVVGTVGTTTSADHLYYGKTLNSGAALPTCFSFPGRVITQAGQGQKIAIFGNTAGNGCMDTTRDVMKYIVHALGLRNEFNRPDRDQFIQVFTANVKPELQSLNIFRLYNATQVDYLNTAFDYNSVTIPTPTKYANAGTVVYTPTQSGQSFGTLARLSQGDCVGLALQYSGCNFAACQNPYAATGTVITGATVTTTGSTTTNTASTTTGSTTTTNTASTTTNTATTARTSAGPQPLEPGGAGVPVLAK